MSCFLMKRSRKQLALLIYFLLSNGNVRLSTLYSFKAPFELLHADITDIRFLAKAAVNSKYCLLFCLFVHIENLHLAHEN